MGLQSNLTLVNVMQFHAKLDCYREVDRPFRAYSESLDYLACLLTSPVVAGRLISGFSRTILIPTFAAPNSV